MRPLKFLLRIGLSLLEILRDRAIGTTTRMFAIETEADPVELVAEWRGVRP